MTAKVSSTNDKPSASAPIGFLSEISIRNHYRQPDMDIAFPPTGEKPFRHLMLTGPNGSGKTTIIHWMANIVDEQLRGNPGSTIEELENRKQVLSRKIDASSGAAPSERIEWKKQLETLEAQLNQNFLMNLRWTRDLAEIADAFRKQRFIAAYLPARRTKNYQRPSGNLPKKPLPVGTTQAASSQWVHYLSYLHVQSRLAREDDPGTADAIAQWLRRLESAVGELFDLPGLKFEFDRKSYDVTLTENGGPSHGFSELADGHASIFQILAEILMRNDEESIVSSVETLGNSPGVVMIDELETHLHPALQEKVFPFLVSMFPNVQFIVTTHSSAVISSIDNALVFDLASREGVESESLRGTPYGELMKIYFGLTTDFDVESTKALGRLAELYKKKPRNTDEESELRSLSQRLQSTSPALALEVWNQLEQDRIAEETVPYKKADSTEPSSE